MYVLCVYSNTYILQYPYLHIHPMYKYLHSTHLLVSKYYLLEVSVPEIG